MDLSRARLLLLHAHPDDETINNGATMAKYARAGAQVRLITCTRGEEGEILLPEFAHMASNQEDKLAEIRVEELMQALLALGVTDHAFLGAPNHRFRDSGMMGSKENERADTFWQADLDALSNLLVREICDFKPHVLITYDEFGGYGHPDHIKANRVATEAAKKSALKGWEIPKIYWNITPRSIVESGLAAMKSAGSDFFGAQTLDELPFVKEDSFVDAVIDGNQFIGEKMAAMRAHRTQIALDGPFFALSNLLGAQIYGREYYTRVNGSPGPEINELGHETDLFSGLLL